MQDPTLQSAVNTLEVAAQAETALAGLYRTCAEIQPEDAVLWTGLETDEVRHAGVVRKLAQIITARPERFRAGRSLNPVGIQSFIAYVESVRERVAAASFTADQLLIVVRDIENSLIELRVSEIVRSDDIEYNTLAAEILAQSFHHRQAVVSRIGK